MTMSEVSVRLHQRFGSGEVLAGPAAVARARAALEHGEIIALPGAGGYRLVCRADDEAACLRLRQRLQRPTRPFALLVRDPAQAAKIAALGDAEAELLARPDAPLLRARRRTGAPVCEVVAPGLADLVVGLPATALQAALLDGLDCPALVLCAAAAEQEPDAGAADTDPLARLRPLAEAFFLAEAPSDFPPVRALLLCGEGAPVVLQRGGFAGVPEDQGFALPVPASQPLLALGAAGRTSICLAHRARALLGPRLGRHADAGHRSARLVAVEEAVAKWGVEPEMIVVDAHPDCAAAALGERLARSWACGVLRVPHHLAHVAAATAEHGLRPAPGQPLGGIALDQGGWGSDGSSWGGELLELDENLRWRRAGYLEALPLVGGERVVREPWRLAVAALVRAGLGARLRELPFANEVEERALVQVADLADRPAWPMSTAAGHVLEAAGALLGLGARSLYPGEVSRRLEALALQAPAVDPWPELTLRARDERFVLPSSELLAAAATRLLDGEPPARIAAGFYDGLCRLLVRLARRGLSPEVRTIALGGGCLANRLLRRGLCERLTGAGYEVRFGQEVPPGDSGLAFGQAALAAAALARGAEPRLVRG